MANEYIIDGKQVGEAEFNEYLAEIAKAAKTQEAEAPPPPESGL